MKLPIDIHKKIEHDFNDVDGQYVINTLIFGIEKSPKRWFESLIRSVVFLANGNLSSFEEWLQFDDFRDVLMAAENRSGNYGHYFRPTFDEIEELKLKIANEYEERLKVESDLPLDFFEQE